MIYPWQHTQWQHCLQLIRQDRMPHALLLTGIEGLGQAAFGAYLAQRLLCEHDDSEPCGRCRQCHLILQGYHPDFIQVMPDEAGKTIKVDQIRQLIAAVSQTPQLAKQQLVLLHPAEAMNEKAANALLKTLEEPSGHVTFILVCHQLASIPITIISRCQQLHFACQADAQRQADTWLRDTTQSPQASIALKLALGAPLLAQVFLETGAIELRNQVLQLMQAVSSRGFSLSVCAAFAKQPIDRVLYFCRLLYQDVMRAHLSISQAYWVNVDQVNQIIRLAAVYSLDGCQRQLIELERLERACRAHITLNWQLAFEGLFASAMV